MADASVPGGETGDKTRDTNSPPVKKSKVGEGPDHTGPPSAGSAQEIAQLITQVSLDAAAKSKPKVTKDIVKGKATKPGGKKSGL